MNTNFQVDTDAVVRYSLSVDTSREYVGSLKSPVSSTGRWCPQHFCQHGAGAFKERTPLPHHGSTTPWGATSDNVHSPARGECPLCCVRGSIRSGSGIPLGKNSEIPYTPPSLSAPASLPGWRESSSAFIVLLVPYCLMSFNLFKAVICA